MGCRNAVSVPTSVTSLFRMLSAFASCILNFAFTEWARQDSNLGPTDYEPAALTAELRAPKQIPNPKSQAPNPKLEIPTHLLIWDLGFGFWDLPRSTFTCDPPKRPSAYANVTGAAAGAAPSLRSGGCVRVSPRSSVRPLRACVRCRRQRRTAS